VFVAEVTVLRDGRPAGVLHPSLNVYPAQPTEPIGTPSIHYGALKDLYSSVLGFQGPKATLRFFLNPGVMWLWVGAGVMAIGGLLAAWPARRRRRAEVPEAGAAFGAATDERVESVGVPGR
jgi:cytochrome c-type biogenesis protein CcmF